ncbi:MAG: hypothetical protein methR_P1204 [Methyloprofundus sp.]|nr:MAG: hypothetical protein methR_P1204 [Methyloprofundus sp.]
MVKRILTLLVVYLILPAIALAAEYTATVSQHQVAVGQSFSLSLTLSDASPESEPDISALKKNFTVNGQVQSSNTSIINGRFSSSTRWDYQLTAKKTGNIRIPSLIIESSKGKLKTQTFNVSVGKASSLPASSENNGIDISSVVSKRNPYKNEPVTYTVTLVSRYDLANISLSEMTLDDAVIEENGKPEVYDSTQNGRAVKVIKASYIITPLKSGEITIPASTIQGGIPIQRRSNSFFGRRFDSFNMMKDFDDLLGRRELKPFAVASKPITLEVLPPVTDVKPWLPASYLGITESWDDTQVLKVGEPISRRFTLIANGISSSQLPSLESLQGKDFKIYADQPVLDESIEDGTIISSRKESYTLIPNKSGGVTLTAIKLRDISFKNNAFSAAYENSASASQMIFYEAGCGAFVQWWD